MKHYQLIATRFQLPEWKPRLQTLIRQHLQHIGGSLVFEETKPDRLVFRVFVPHPPHGHTGTHLVKVTTDLTNALSYKITGRCVEVVEEKIREVFNSFLTSDHE